MLGQAHHFRTYVVETIDYAICRYTKEAARLYGVLNIALSKSEFIAGKYSIADMAIVPWIMPYKRQGQDLADFPHLRRWIETLKARPAVRKGLDAGKDLHPVDTSTISNEARQNLFGAKQYGAPAR
jgi:GST-like protein